MFACRFPAKMRRVHGGMDASILVSSLSTVRCALCPQPRRQVHLHVRAPGGVQKPEDTSQGPCCNKLRVKLRSRRAGTISGDPSWHDAAHQWPAMCPELEWDCQQVRPTRQMLQHLGWQQGCSPCCVAVAPPLRWTARFLLGFAVGPSDLLLAPPWMLGMNSLSCSFFWNPDQCWRPASVPSASQALQAGDQAAADAAHLHLHLVARGYFPRACEDGALVIHSGKGRAENRFACLEAVENKHLQQSHADP